MRQLRLAAAVAAVLLCACSSAYAQSVTGQVSGTVTDSSDAPISGAAVQLTHDLTQQVRAATTEPSGAFVFPNLVPGAYSIQISHPGFKTYRQQAITVSASEKV